MERACIDAGVGLRPNNSLARILGSSGWASAGNGWGLTLPLSCALAVSPAKNTKASSEKTAPCAKQRHGVGVLMVNVMLTRSDREIRRPLEPTPFGDGVQPRAQCSHVKSGICMATLAISSCAARL